MTKSLRCFAAVYYRRERFRVQARPADERAIQLFLRHQSLDIVGLDAAAVQNTHRPGLLRGKLSLGTLPQKTVRPCGNFRRCRFACANCPDWLVGYQNTGELFRGQRARPAQELPFADFFRATRFSLLQQSTDEKRVARKKSANGNSWAGRAR